LPSSGRGRLAGQITERALRKTARELLDERLARGEVELDDERRSEVLDRHTHVGV
jgi:uncharacterized membrane protein